MAVNRYSSYTVALGEDTLALKAREDVFAAVPGARTGSDCHRKQRGRRVGRSSFSLPVMESFKPPAPANTIRCYLEEKQSGRSQSNN